MNKLLFLPLLLIAIGISKHTNASTFSFKAATDTVRKKLVHPKEAVAGSDLTTILNTMRGKRNDQEKVVALKAAVKDKAITIDQLITLLNQFLTDDAKLECAEYAFPYTTNYKAFLDIMNIFSEEGYKHKLEDFYNKARIW